MNSLNSTSRAASLYGGGACVASMMPSTSAHAPIPTPSGMIPNATKVGDRARERRANRISFSINDNYVLPTRVSNCAFGLRDSRAQLAFERLCKTTSQKVATSHDNAGGGWVARRQWSCQHRLQSWRRTCFGFPECNTAENSSFPQPAALYTISPPMSTAMIAFWMWSRFSASSHTRLCGPSITSAATSSPR